MSSPTNTSSVVVFVSGANKGIGLAIISRLASNRPDWILLMGTRSIENGKKAIEKLKSDNPHLNTSNIIPVELDQTNKETIDKAYEQISRDYGHVDILINNAAIASFQDSKEIARQTFDTNYYGVISVSEKFESLLELGKFHVNTIVSSEVGPWATHEFNEEIQRKLLPETNDHTNVDEIVEDFVQRYDGNNKFEWPQDMSSFFASYGASKAFLNGWATQYVKRLAKKQSKIQLFLVCPGYCATDLNNNQGPRTTDQGAQSVLAPVEQYYLSDNTTHISNGTKYLSGKFYQDAKPLVFKHKPHVPQNA